MKTTTYTCGDKLVAFEKVEDLLFQLIAELITIFSEAELNEIQKFIDVAEYGLALETVMAIYLEEKKFISSKALNLIECLGAAMSMDVKSLLKGL
ncbi:MafI family immunity protein [Comamonas sp.]|uniref:MafI family immunity protein n=1 Tax=Comamonas sp. TaxID=34028 RepID=UPI0028999305|nr:MafI family immunity protein [Comamonas sp.]